MLDELAREGGPSLAFRFDLMKRRLCTPVSTDGMIAMTMAHVDVPRGDDAARSEAPTSARTAVRATLRYGENPHQRASGSQPPPDSGRPGRCTRARNCRTRTCWTSTRRCASRSSSPSRPRSVIKHTNPCGVATGATIDAAYVRAREADPLSAFGGIVGLNRAIDVATARALTSTFIEAIIAPSIDGEARAMLAAKTEPARRDGGLRKSVRTDAGRDPMRDAVVSRRRAACSSADRVIEAARAMAVRRFAEGGARNGSRRPRSGRPCASRGACARTSNRTRLSLPARIARWRSARGR